MSRAGLTILCLLAALATAPAAGAGQQGGSIYYGDYEVIDQRLEFKAAVWRVRDGYFRTVARYRRVGSDQWKGLDRNWCWTRRCALREMVDQARYLARDGYIWRFQEPTRPPNRAKSVRFTESCYRGGTGTCAARLTGRV